MGVEGGQFFLAHGGFEAGYTAYGETFEKPAGGSPPQMRLPPIEGLSRPEQP
jgi:hypothetical protein